jgi:hypothetical protein
MTYYPDLGETTQIASGPHVRAIGWLDAQHPFARGVFPVDSLAKLAEFADSSFKSVVALGWPVAMGRHTCEICGAASSGGNFGVPAGRILFVCPEMLYHYVEAHAYLPPPEFLSALVAAPLAGTDAYAEEVARFVE